MQTDKYFLRYWGRVARGVCVKCGRNPPMEGKKSCFECSRAMNKYQNERNRRILAAGECVKCRAKNDNGYTICDECKKIAHQKYLLRREKRNAV